MNLSKVALKLLEKCTGITLIPVFITGNPPPLEY